MPAYNTAQGVPCIYPSDLAYAVFSGETLSVNEVSQQVAVSRQNEGEPGITVELQFSANPGVFEIDLQEADTDATNFYLNVASAVINAATQGADSKYYARFDAASFAGQFARLFVKTWPNTSVTCIAKIRKN